MLDKVKLALRLTTDAYDEEIQQLIDAAVADLGIAGIGANFMRKDALIIRAVITYCRVHFGSPDDFERVKASYDEQKAQLQCASGYRKGDMYGSCGCTVSDC